MVRNGGTKKFRGYQTSFSGPNSFSNQSLTTGLQTTGDRSGGGNKPNSRNTEQFNNPYSNQSSTSGPQNTGDGVSGSGGGGGGGGSNYNRGRGKFNRGRNDRNYPKNNYSNSYSNSNYSTNNEHDESSFNMNGGTNGGKTWTRNNNQLHPTRYNHNRIQENDGRPWFEDNRANHPKETVVAPQNEISAPADSSLVEPNDTKKVPKEPVPSVVTPEILHKIKSERPETSTPKKEAPNTPVKPKKEKPKQVPDVQQKKDKEIVTTPKTKKVIKEKPQQTSKKTSSSSESDESSSSSDSSSDSSSSEDEIPKMPNPIKKTKKEGSSEDDLVCLGIPENVQLLIEEDEKCLVCKTEGHSGTKCQAKCLKCSQSSYTMQIVCTHCGETYPKTEKMKTAPPLNPFAMFMQFMQFCMTQYKDAGAEMFPYPVGGPIPHQGSTQAFEVTRKDIDNTKRERKRVKSELKQIRKKKKSEKNSDSDSDGNSMATTSTKKRRIHSLSEQQQIPQTQQQTLPPFASPFPGMFPFAAGGYNPMLAFNQMMGYNQTPMNFQK